MSFYIVFNVFSRFFEQQFFFNVSKTNSGERLELLSAEKHLSKPNSFVFTAQKTPLPKTVDKPMCAQTHRTWRV